MNKPTVKTKKHLDWIEVSRYLQDRKEFNNDKLWKFFCGCSDFHNGCYVTLNLEEICAPEEKRDEAIVWFVKTLFEEWPDAADKQWGDISLWVWW